MNDQLPPHSLDDERMLLSCCIQDRNSFHEVNQSVSGIAAFYHLAHAEMWGALQGMDSDGEHIDVPAFLMRLPANLRAEAVEISNLATSAWNFQPHLSKVVECEQKRNIVFGCAEVSGMANNGHSLASIAEASERLLAVDIKAPPMMGGKECAQRSLADIEARFRRGGELTGLSTGFRDLDELTDGWQAGDMVVIGARPSIGKTAIGIQFFCESVFRLNVPALFYSLEMSTDALMRRMVGMERRISLKDLRKGNLTEKNFASIAAFHGDCLKAPMQIIDSTSPGIAEVCATIRRAHRKHGIKLVVVDYLQKIKASEKNEKRTYEVGEVSGRLKDVAKKTGMVIIALAQLNRESEKDKGRMPRLSDLADSGQIERDADVVGLIHRDRTQAVGEASLIIAKQRDGETGIVDMTFLGYFGRFESRTNQNTPTQNTPTHNDP